MFEKKNNPQRQNEIALRRFFDQYNIKYDYNVDNEHRTRRYTFRFQGGYFTATFYGEMSIAEIQFPNCFETDVNKLPVMRAVCNRFNVQTVHFKYCYEFNEEENVANLFISFATNTFDESLLILLESFFRCQRDFIEEFEVMSKETGKSADNDLEQRFAASERELFLMRQQEIAHQDVDPNMVITNVDDMLTMGDIAHLLKPLAMAQLTHLTCVQGDKVITIKGSEQIRNFRLAETLYDLSDDVATVINRRAVLSLIFNCVDNNDGNRHATIVLNTEQSDDNTAYYRVTFALVPLSINRGITDECHSGDDKIISFLAAVDLRDNTKRRQEFDYQWHDTLIKIKDGKMEELTPDQQILIGVEQTNVSYNIYWGHRHMLAEHYAQALLFLESAYHSMREEFMSYDRRSKESFYEVCYLIGFCYNKLKQYDRAFYYLHILSEMGKVRYMIQYINTLVGAGDVRAIPVITDVENTINQEFYDDDIPEQIVDFKHFLTRRKIYACVELNMLNTARELLTEIVDDPIQSDFALQELAVVNKLIEKRGTFENDVLDDVRDLPK